MGTRRVSVNIIDYKYILIYFDIFEINGRNK